MRRCLKRKKADKKSGRGRASNPYLFAQHWPSTSELAFHVGKKRLLKIMFSSENKLYNKMNKKLSTTNLGFLTSFRGQMYLKNEILKTYYNSNLA